MKEKTRKLKNGIIVQESIWKGFSDDEIITAYKELDDSPDLVVVWDGKQFVAKGEGMVIITSSNGELGSWTLRKAS